MLEGFWEVHTGSILPLDRWGNGRKGSRQIIVGEASRGLASAPVVAKKGSVQIVVEVTHTQSVHEVKNISPESGKRKLKGPPLLVWGKNGKMWIEEWFMRWGVGGKGACPV